MMSDASQPIPVFPHRHLLGIADLSADDIRQILDLSETFLEVSERPIKKVPTLRGKTVINLFLEASTRTRTSFEIAAKRLSADAVNISGSTSSTVKGETLIDTARNLQAMAPDVIVLRHGASGGPALIAQHIDAAVVNAGDGMHEHPTQALLDAFSMQEKLGDLKGKKVVIVGDILHSRVALSNIFCLQKLGAQVKVCGPLTLIPRYITSLGVEVETNLRKALEWCDVANMLRIQLERQDIKYFPSLREYTMMYGLDKELLESLSKKIVIMHPGPINRGVEITSDVADHPQSIILEQVENGVAVRMAVMFLLAGRQGN